MPLQSNWEHIDVPLPELRYQNTTTSGQGKGSTEWAAHSHSPVGVQTWDDFDNLVAAEAQKPSNSVEQDIDFLGDLSRARLNRVSSEEDVTNRLETILSVFADETWNLTAGITFPQQNQQLIGNPDIVASNLDDEALCVGLASKYSSPPPGKRAKVRRDTTKVLRSLYRLPFETKPFWKFRFLKTTNDVVGSWEVPDDFDPTMMQAEVPLPESWPASKKKVFHLVRQLYGQMVADNRRYGIFHTYELWFFCKRSVDGILHISRAFGKSETSPSVFQAIKTMVGFDDFLLGGGAVHPRSASKAPRKSKRKKGPDQSNRKRYLMPPSSTKDNSDNFGSGGMTEGTDTGTNNLAASLSVWDCDVYDYTDHILLLTTTKIPFVVVKLQKDAKKEHVSAEMANEAATYKVLRDNAATRDVVPNYHGFSDHLGVAMACIEKELDDFDDIGLANVSMKLKQSAVKAIEALSRAGILHNDIELRNIVQSRSDPDRAKIIDFGRASLSQDKKRLADQVDHMKHLLGL